MFSPRSLLARSSSEIITSPSLPHPFPHPQRIHLNYIMHHLMQRTISLYMWSSRLVRFALSTYLVMFLCLLIRSISTPVDNKHCWISKSFVGKSTNIDFFLYYMLAKYICSYLVTTLISSEEAQNPTSTQSRIDLHATFSTNEYREKSIEWTFSKQKIMNNETSSFWPLA